ncbi:nucleotide exchange factor GrpE [Desulfitibacter alkalitolerans]|uniref:nucleotide exchange factor GrpE n=1 Tax=Desulfitibacter alkalitolerans TaxID=264641 RepID=UPI000483B098|nr:nucleotide exchange factor GrpE [Desulfitibacter alkalitolerans]
MFWKFWNNSKLDSELVEINKRLDAQEKTNQLLLEKLDENSQQGNKMLRMHYKATQEIIDGQEKYMKSFLMLEQLKTEHQQLQMQNNAAVNCLIEILDDIDLAIIRLHDSEVHEEGKDSWQGLFKGWANRILEALRDNGIIEIELLGKGFDPLYAESIGTVTKEQLNMEITAYCQIVTIFKRGFVNSDGILLRKAQVITVADSEYEDLDSNGEEQPN